MRYLILPLPSPKYARALRAATRTALRMATWNAAFIIAGLLLIALAGEAYLRLTKPFIENSTPRRFVDKVGLIREPNAEVRYGRWDDDFFVVSRTNSQGFLDREPISPERAAEGCHIAFIGDSYVEAKGVPIADKFHVRLEEMAARELPRLNITTHAYGISVTGQINQIPFYDEYARHLNPKLVALVFFINDFYNNLSVMQSVTHGLDPVRTPFMSAQKDARGNLELRPPDPEYERFLLPRAPMRWYENAYLRVTAVSYFAKWVGERVGYNNSIYVDNNLRNREFWTNALAKRPCCAALLGDWRPGEIFPYESTLEHTAFGIEQFKRRADRDGARLVILAATGDMGTRGDQGFDLLTAVAEPLDIPVISDYDYIVRQGYDEWDGRYRNDTHWNADGHQWVAETFLEWLKVNQQVCD